MSKEKARARPVESPDGGESPKRPRFDRCFSGLEFKMEKRPLKELDPEKVKKEIKRWAKAVVAYARQLSGSFSSKEKISGTLSGSFSSREKISGKHSGSFSSHEK